MPIASEFGTFRVANGEVAAESNGLRPWSSAARNAEALQEVLDGLGYARLTYPGTYYFDDSISVPYGCKFFVGPGVTLVRPDGENLLSGPSALAGPYIQGPVELPSMAQAPSAWCRLLSILEQGLSDANVLICSDSTANQTTEWPYLLFAWFAQKFPAYTFQIRYWNSATPDYDAAVTIQSGTGARTVVIWVAAVAGWWIKHFFAATQVAALQPADCQLVIVSHHHNAADLGQFTNMGLYASLVGQLAQMHSTAGVLCMSGNPRVSPDANNIRMQYATQSISMICMQTGWEYLDVYKAFTDLGESVYTSMISAGDGVHPLDAGSRFWAGLVAQRIPYSSKFALPQNLFGSPALRATRNLIVDPRFAAYTTGTPAGWTQLGSTAYQKDTTNFVHSNFSVQMTGGGSGQAGATYSLPLPDVKGRWVTFAALLFCPSAGLTNTQGRLGIVMSGGSGTNATSPPSGTRAPDGWAWEAISAYVPNDVTSVFARIFADSASNTTKSISVAQVFCGEGIIPSFS